MRKPTIIPDFLLFWIRKNGTELHQAVAAAVNSKRCDMKHKAKQLHYAFLLDNS